MEKPAGRELTYHAIDDDGYELVTEPPRVRDAGHVIDACDKPICVLTRRIIAERGDRQRDPR